MTPAQRLTARLDELASSLHRAGAGDVVFARLLELAALATMKAVSHFGICFWTGSGSR